MLPGVQVLYCAPAAGRETASYFQFRHSRVRMTRSGGVEMSPQILVVEDDAGERSDLAEMVASFGFQVATAADGREALEKLASFPANAILTDLVMPVLDGVALLKELAARGDRTPTVVLTAFGSIDQAISIVHDLKAFWFIEKPVQPAVLRTLLERAIQQSHLVEETERLSRQLSYQGVLGDLVGNSPPMQEVFSLDSPGRAHYGLGSDHRRERNGQGAGGASDSQSEPAQWRSIRSGELRCLAGKPDGERTLRPRKRRIHWRRGAQRGVLRTGSKRDPVAR